MQYKLGRYGFPGRLGGSSTWAGNVVHRQTLVPVGAACVARVVRKNAAPLAGVGAEEAKWRPSATIVAAESSRMDMQRVE